MLLASAPCRVVKAFRLNLARTVGPRSGRAKQVYREMVLLDYGLQGVRKLELDKIKIERGKY